MLSDLLSSVAHICKIFVDSDDYLLARVEVDGLEMFAEVSRGSSGGIPPGEWPRVEGTLPPDSTICPEDETDSRILLFSIPQGGRLLQERISAGGPLSEGEAVVLGIGVLNVLRRLHQDGTRVGYLGPENIVLTASGPPLILAGARGIPDSPFSPPEAIGISPEDPRSDVFALGLMMFRAVAGSDSRDVQVAAWNSLSEQMASLLERMVALETGDRFPNLAAVAAEFDGLRSTPPGDEGGLWRDRSEPRGGRSRMTWIIPLLLLAAAASWFLFIRPGGGGHDGTSEPGPVPHDSTTSPVPAEASPDTVEVLDTAVPAAPVVWVSNGTGETGIATTFREGPASDISAVYTCTASPRRSSVLLLRRDDPTVPMDQQARLLPLAMQLADGDSTLQLLPVDITILLGADLITADAAPGIAPPVTAPAGTLFIDIANHGVMGTFSGAGAATWTRSILHGRSVMIDGAPWILQVVDFRDGDMYNPELGIPSALDSTVFLYRTDSPVLKAAESSIRFGILGDSASAAPRSWLPDVPDAWVLLGS